MSAATVSSISFIESPTRAKFRRSGLSWLLLLPNLAVVLLLPMLFISLLLVSCWWLVMQTHDAINEFALGHLPAWRAGAQLCLLSLGYLNCLLLFKPLFVKAPRRPSTRLLKAMDHPELFELLSDLQKISHSMTPSEVQVDNSMRVRMKVTQGVFGWLKGRTVLEIGLPLAASTTTRELAGAIINQMARHPAGLHGRLLQIFSGMNAWLDWAVCRRDPWEQALAQAVKSAPKRRGLPVRLAHAFVWLTQRPVWVFMAVARVASAGPMRRMVRDADKCEAKIVGSKAFAEALPERGRFERAWQEAGRKVQEGVKAERLPDNLPLLAARHAKPTGQKNRGNEEGVDSQGSLFCPSDEARIRHALAWDFKPLMEGTSEASSLFRDFNDLARQSTQFYYQQDLGLNLSRCRVVAAEETLKQRHVETASFGFIERFFQGMADPDRVVCGLVQNTSAAHDLPSFVAELKSCRQWMPGVVDQVRMLRREWSKGWQRCRDLEMGHAFALAGMPLDNHQYGVAAHSAPLYREEHDSQAVSLSFTEESLVHCEAKLESLLTAALGLVALSPPHTLPEALAARAAELEWQAGLYVVLGQQLAHMRNLTTLFNAYQALGLRHVGASMPLGLPEALRYLAPRIARLAGQSLQPLQAVPSRSAPNLAAELSGMDPTEALAFLGRDWDRLGTTQDLGIVEAVALGQLVERFSDQFFSLYHRVFDWLSETAEMAETHFVRA